jgi:hypothetical protein
MPSRPSALPTQAHQPKSPRSLGMTLLLPVFMEDSSTNDSSESLKSSETTKSIENSPRSSVATLVPSIFPKEPSTKSDKSADASREKSSFQPARSYTQVARTVGAKIQDTRKATAESDLSRNGTQISKSEHPLLLMDCITRTAADNKQKLGVEVRGNHVTSLVSHFERLGGTTDARKVPSPSSAPPIEHTIKQTTNARKMGPNPKPQSASHLEPGAWTPNVNQPKKTFTHRVLRFLCISANPDDNDYTPPCPSQLSSRGSIKYSGRQTSTFPQRSSAKMKRAHQKEVGMQTHTNGTRTAYVPRYTSKSHAISTSGKSNRKAGKGASTIYAPTSKWKKQRPRRSVGILMEGTDAGLVAGSFSKRTFSSPIALSTASSRRLNPKLHRAHIGAINDDWIQQYLPEPTQKRVKSHLSSNYRRSHSPSRSTAIKPSLPKNSRIPTHDKPAFAGYTSSQASAFSRDLPLVKQVIEEEQTDEETRQDYNDHRYAAKVAARRSEQYGELRARKGEQAQKGSGDTFRKDYPGQHVLEKISLRLYRSKMREIMKQFGKDGVSEITIGSRNDVENKRDHQRKMRSASSSPKHTLPDQEEKRRDGNKVFNKWQGVKMSRRD